MVTLDSRLDFQLSVELKELIQEAASLRGQSVDDFVISTMAETSRRIVQQHSMTVLSDRDRDRFLTLLDSDEPPNEALQQAARRFRGQDVLMRKARIRESQ